MKKSHIFFTICILIINWQVIFGQNEMPILKTTTDVISIKDGDQFRKDYWTISPEYKLDVYTADKTNKEKTIIFYSDIDSISFKLKPTEIHDFLILLNGKDSCFTRIESGIRPQVKTNLPPTHDTIPFILTDYNNISIQAILNEKDTLNLMFHSAANSVSIIEEVSKELTSLKFDKSTEGNTWGGRGTFRATTDQTIQIGNFKWENITLFEGKHSGHETDGKFGPNLFEDKIIEIDYDNSIMIIHANLPEKSVDYQKLNLIFNQSSMFLEGNLQIGEDTYQNKFLIHSGFSGTLLFDDIFVAKNKFSERLETIGTRELKDSNGNVLVTKKVVLPAVSFGETTFSDIPIGFFDGAIGRQKMSVVGADILKRFNILIDLQNAYIYLKPSSLFKQTYFE